MEEDKVRFRSHKRCVICIGGCDFAGICGIIAMAVFIELNHYKSADRDYSYKLHIAAWVISIVGGALNLVGVYGLA